MNENQISINYSDTFNFMHFSLFDKLGAWFKMVDFLQECGFCVIRTFGIFSAISDGYGIFLDNITNSIFTRGRL